MMAPTHAHGLASLRRFLTVPPPVERCELCTAPLAGAHQHVIEPANRRILCACDACAILFDDSGVTRYRRVPRDVRALPGFAIVDERWNTLAIPIGLVFFFRSSVSGSIVAVYPSPAGPAEIAVDEEDWQAIAAPGLAPDVEALLVNRTRQARDYLIVPIDECYKLTGLIRQHWHGFTGGDEVWDRIHTFFDDLRRRARA
jgi:hypothetical protein